MVNGLLRELEKLYESVVNRCVTSDAAENVLSLCHSHYLGLKKFERMQQHKQGLLEQEKDFTAQLHAITKNLQIVRQVLGELIKVLESIDSPGSVRVPASYEKRHSAVETAIEDIFLVIDIFQENHGGIADSSNPSGGGSRDPRSPGDAEDKHHYRSLQRWLRELA